MGKINEILNGASNIGACNGSQKVTDWKSLVWLFFSPQGREFCEEHNYPPLSVFQDISDDVVHYGVYVDVGAIEKNNDAVIALVGDTDAKLTFTDNSQVHKVILMHGAKASLRLRNYTVVLLVNIGGCEIEIDKDDTSVLLR